MGVGAMGSPKNSHGTRKPVKIDDRVGSRELLPELRKLHCPTEKVRLPFADAAFEGEGEKGPVKVGVERKTVGDLIQSMTSGRLSSHQLPGLVQEYDYRWIVVEGLWRPGRDGVIEVWRKGGWRQADTRLGWFEVDRYLTTLEVRGGCWVRRTGSLWETAVLVNSLYKWWGKDWKEHRGHLQLEKGLMPDRVLYTKPSYPRLVASVLPGIGWEKSKAVAKRFRTVRAMVEAGPAEWRQVPGIGKTLGLRLPMILEGVKGVEGSRED